MLDCVSGLWNFVVRYAIISRGLCDVSAALMECVCVRVRVFEWVLIFCRLTMQYFVICESHYAFIYYFAECRSVSCWLRLFPLETHRLAACVLVCDFQFVFGVRVFLAFCVSIWQIKVQASRNSISRLILPRARRSSSCDGPALCANFKCGKSPFFRHLFAVWFKLRKAHVLLFVSIACWRARVMDSEVQESFYNWDYLGGFFLYFLTCLGRWNLIFDY